MNFCMPIFNKPFVVDENHIPILIVENKNMFQCVIQSFYGAVNGENCENFFFIEDNELDLYKDMEVIVDFFSLDLNSTKNITKLHNTIKQDISGTELYVETNDLYNHILAYLEEIINLSSFPLEYDISPDITPILKSASLRFTQENKILIEKLIDYITITHQFFNKKIFVLVNFKSMFSVEEQLDFYKFLHYKKINVLLVESEVPIVKNDSEIHRIIDKDLCVIY